MSGGTFGAARSLERIMLPAQALRSVEHTLDLTIYGNLNDYRVRRRFGWISADTNLDTIFPSAKNHTEEGPIYLLIGENKDAYIEIAPGEIGDDGRREVIVDYLVAGQDWSYVDSFQWVEEKMDFSPDTFDPVTTPVDEERLRFHSEDMYNLLSNYFSDSDEVEVELECKESSLPEQLFQNLPVQ